MGHDGQGGACPGCQRLLRIPAAGEILPPLVAPLEGLAPEVNEQDSFGSQIQPLRRGKNERHGVDQSWEKKSERVVGFVIEENRQMFWMLIVGVTLFSLAFGVVAVAVFNGDESESRPLAVPAPGIPVQSETSETVSQAQSEKVDAALLAEAELVVRKFLEARRIEEMLPLVRNPEVTEARMRSHYSRGAIEESGMREFNTGGGFYSVGSSFEVQVRTRDDQQRSLLFCNTPEGIKIDWESWVGWSEMPWEEFMSTKPSDGKLFRVMLDAVTYYNFAFSDERKWKAYRLESADGESAVYGYVERDSELDSQLKIPRGSKQIALTLSLKFPADAKADNQVLIEKLIAKGWLLETVKTP